MQQPYAAAMVAGKGLYTRRGQPKTFTEGGEWIAIHCGQNNTHLNPITMPRIRKAWPECPSDDVLRKGQRSILGIARFVDSVWAAIPPASTDPLLANYDW